MEATIVETFQRSTAPVTVAVGHSSTLVSAGLAATIGRLPGFSVRMWREGAAEQDSEGAPAPQLIFGDPAFLQRLRGGAIGSSGTPSSAKFVLVTNGKNKGAHASKASGEVDECVPLECPEDQFFAIIRRLVSAAPAADDVGASSPATRTPIRGGLAPGALRRVREHIERNLAKRVPIEALASVAGLSLGHFNRAFKQSLGLSPHQYVLNRRIAIATELLANTSRSLADIALDVGFADQSHFSRTFVAVTGETPRACRHRNR